ncbi:MAG: hypothetical protein DRI97_17655 [Bacteroidetes bacterium]|nr:MAG: hypothetical protein DRI97_17655 [Bacteroidota bacterium]
MGAIIKACSVSTDETGTSYLSSAASAVKNCLEQLSPVKKGVGLLINTGVYPDRHIHEPAIASLIQGVLQKSFRAILKGTFSFDLHSGGGGVVMALSIINGFIESGKIDYGVVVAGDSVPFDGTAGALMIGRGQSDEGFKIFSQDTYTHYSSDFRSYSNYSGNAVELFINQDHEYLNHCLQCVKKSVRRFLLDSALSDGEIDLIIPSQSPEGFASALADLYDKERVVVSKGEHKCYSAEVIVAIADAQSGEIFRNSRKVLFINVGPGIIVDLALYLNPW